MNATEMSPPFRFEKVGVWYVIFHGSFSVWHTRAKAHASKVVAASNIAGKLVFLPK